MAYLPGLCSEEYASSSEKRYAADSVNGGTFNRSVVREVYYSTKSVDEYVNPYAAPAFNYARTSCCAVTAGGNIMVYYDRLFDELVPNYKPISIFGRFSYGVQNAGVDAMFDSLYNYMGTSDLGTTVEGFKNGMKNYAASKGRTLTATRATGSYYNINLETVKAQLKKEKAVAIFLDPFSIVPFTQFKENSGYDEINTAIFSGAHTMFAYGYKDITYYDANGNVKQRDTYLYASTGFNNYGLALLDLTHNGTVVDVYVVEVT